jgi:hypothetical protein
MNYNAVDGVYVHDVPLSVNTDSDFGEDLKYINIPLFSEGNRVLPLGKTSNDHPDTVVAPGTQFRIMEYPVEITTIWMCVAQPFYYE